ncbi:NAD(P)H:quinone oxidoreductase [Glycomyces buryatensis]|uniref:NAD(P)H:quinone oxidoreductase n=1 Tax=Glycomyces buryatensis TaxID=2570927 RepID=A0A4V4HSZ3_9ACTN|nr:NAD(P)H:quinone oxidoreductase [Glycomyces buryatensis]THV43556.1 NAD(P)H:quinone oxidoreductase [Glycomyces buryatensis]
MVKLAVIFYSQTGNVYEMAKTAAREGEDAGAEVRLRKCGELAPPEVVASNEHWAKTAEAMADVREASLDDLEWADALMFGTPTRYGLPTSQLKQFIDTTGQLWAQGRLEDRIMSSFTSTQTSHGGQESTILALNNTFYHWGGIIVGPGYTDPLQYDSEIGNPYGASHISSNGPVGEKNRVAVAIQTKRVVAIARRFAGR